LRRWTLLARLLKIDERTPHHKSPALDAGLAGAISRIQ
jgi:hypothetical protein